ncbi:putative tellurium resistance protein (TerY-like) [Desulfamplus magnetovallimortis]|uniref:Putative tellurium resistance protein (TerY-like) n=1 Tax=Desulfamplus magnetovallimortis TaxID=1246637 RepID=A0A1W1HAE3_9BACT|nr:VWA domain-containing protein [Desulfamplus magnetovallimortis]SLM29413.1 putative tellurium resistance protein (TerY-like) [Desulfamplus magnetovallimortis]
MSRRLPVYIAIDTSGSMYGEPIQSVNVGLQAMASALRQDPHALDSVALSIITFDINVKELFPLTPLEDVQIPEIKCPRSGPTYIGEALALVVDRVKKDIVLSTSDRKGDWRPMLFLMTDGSPSDIARFNEIIPKLKECHFAKIIACAAGPKAKKEYMRQITDTVVSLDTTDSTAFASFFKWVSASVEMRSASIGAGTSNELPPPPDEIQIVI